VLVCLQSVDSPYCTWILSFFPSSSSHFHGPRRASWPLKILAVWSSELQDSLTQWLVSYPRTPGCSAALLWPSRGYNRNMFLWCELDWAGSESCLVDGLPLHSISRVCYNSGIAHWLVCLLVLVRFWCKLICLVLTITWCVWYVPVK